MLLRLRNLSKSYDRHRALNSISLEIGSGEIVALLGPSGCGKTTLLRIIAGLESPDEGQLWLNNLDLKQIPVHKRGFGMVFQEYALFPHKSVAENVSFGLRMMNWPKEMQDRRVEEVLQLVGLQEFGNRRVYDLSGGEQQRVALARSLAPAPRLMLLDEPLGALDRSLRERLMGELRRILKKAGSVLIQGQDATEGITSIYVTHDQEEAFAIADRIIVMNEGRIEQVGQPSELYRAPANQFVAHFLGMNNQLPATLLSRQPLRVRSPIGDLEVAGVFPERPHIRLLIRPDSAILVDHEGENVNIIAGRVIDISFRGWHQIATISIGEGENPVSLKLSFDSDVRLPPSGEVVHLKLDPQKLQLLSV